MQRNSVQEQMGLTLARKKSVFFCISPMVHCTWKGSVSSAAPPGMKLCHCCVRTEIKRRKEIGGGGEVVPKNEREAGRKRKRKMRT